MTEYFSAKHWSEKARKQAVGTITENPDGSAKYWAEKAMVAAESVSIPTPTAADAGKFLMTTGTESQWQAIDFSSKANTDFTNVDEENAHKLIGNRIWISGEYEPVAATRTIVTHSLNLDPLKARGEVLLKCVSDEAGYTAGEYCSNWTPNGSNGNLAFPINSGVTVTANTIETTTGGNSIAALHKTGSNQYAFLTLSKWRYVFRIFY